MYRHLDFAASCAQIKKAGCAGVDLWSTPRMCEHIVPQSDAREIKRIVRDNGLEPVAFTAYHTLSQSESLDRFLWSLDFAAEVGAPRVVTNGIDWKGDRASFLKHIAPALVRAKERGVKISFENHSGQPFSGTGEELLALAEAETHPFFGFTVAPAHLATRRSDVPATIRGLKGRIFFYAWDHVPGVDDDGKQFRWPPPDPLHQFPGKGALDFAEFLRALRDAQYETTGGWLNIRSYPRYHPDPWETDRITTELACSVKYLATLD